ncbi:jacalin-related lectin 3-like [Abrus precatorius]|uniref:Mannose/glucose-specific lectin n=1 Tax=Abrus precatorius TaxID=3816 RepID=A0A8B8JYG3_ABRPR|nr:jacalin-related lectin 3-like [Abrus precatorius]
MSFEEKPVSIGPWGGNGGYHWDDGVYSTVRQLVIVHGEGIDSIQIEYDRRGSSVWSKKYGGSGGHKIDKIKLDYPNEFLKSIDGYFGSLSQWGVTFIRSLSFESNKKIYGPFGVEQGTYFSLPMTGGKIVGFHGRYGWHLDAIGVYLKSSQQPSPSKTLSYSQNHITNTPENVGYSVIHGSVGQGFDIVLALRQKDDFAKPPTIGKIPSYQEPNNIEPTWTISSFTDPNTNVEPTGKISSFKEPDNVEPSGMISSFKETNNIEPNEKIDQSGGVVTYGPWGGTGGYVFDDGPYTGVRQIDLSRNVGIVWIRVLYDLEGEAVWGHKHGGAGGFKHEKIVFNFPYEVLTHISGYHGSLMYMGLSVIKSLTFHTTKRVYGPFGDEQGTYFTTKLKEGKVAGIHGRSGLFLDALGVHVIEGKVTVPVATPPSMTNASREPSISEKDTVQWPAKLLAAKSAPIEQVSSGVIKEPAPCGPGPWGGDGGRPWDDGVFSGIKQIYLTRAPEGICSIQIEYDRHKQSVWSVKHGGNGGNTMHRIKLEYPNEVLNCISGYYGSITADERPIIIKSLTFYTSRGQYGPFGDEVGKFFTSTTTEGKVVGLHGKSSMYLDAIGVHMQHWLGSHKTSKSSFFKLF